ncbi:MAG: FadR family transcriptional regulator [Comamonadaceae bacterium]|nr:MAG: FadR family transcriptional regulator [Comamonadaceae bacterium]
MATSTAASTVDSPPAFVTGTLGTRVAAKLLEKIRQEGLQDGTRLPSEQSMAELFGVSRTVVREAIALLKSDGLVSTRKGSGAFVCGTSRAPALLDVATTQQVHSLLNLIEVRRGLESEVAALAAVRRTPGQLAEIEHALRRIGEAAAAGVNGVEEDVNFHLCIARATGNPYWLRFVEMFADSMRSAVQVTRANEARRADFSGQVREEHEKIVNAIAAGDPERARQAAAEHMVNAAERIRLADREFWKGAGGELARNVGRGTILDGSAG